MGVDLRRRGRRAPAGHPGRRKQPGARRPSSRNARRGGVAEADVATQEKKGLPTGLFVNHPLTGEQVRSLGRQLRADALRRWRRDGRAGPRRARLRLRPQVRPADQAGGRAPKADDLQPGAWHDWYGDKQPGTCINSGELDGLASRPPSTPSQVADRRKGLGEQRPPVPPARLGHQPPALLGLPDPDHPLRRPAATCRCPEDQLPVVLPEDVGAGRRRLAAGRACPSSTKCSCPKCGKPAPSAKPTPWTPSSSQSVVLPALRLADNTRAAMVDDARRLLDADGPVHRRHRARHPAPAVRALLDRR